MKTPPLLPEETLHRVLRMATFDGWSVLGIAGALALASAAVGDFWGAAIGLTVAAAGAIELHGAALLRAGETRGMNWLLASQPYLLAVMLGYCALCLWTYDSLEVRATLVGLVKIMAYTPTEIADLRLRVAAAGYTEERFLRQLYTTGYVAVAIVTLIYQGRMTVYYYQRRAAVTTAIEGENEPGDFN